MLTGYLSASVKRFNKIGRNETLSYTWAIPQVETATLLSYCHAQIGATVQYKHFKIYLVSINTKGIVLKPVWYKQLNFSS